MKLLQIRNGYMQPIAFLRVLSNRSPENIKKSYDDGAASFVPKEKMADITTFLNDILEAKEKGKNLWWRWFDRLADYFEKKFGPDWQKEHGIKVR